MKTLWAPESAQAGMGAAASSAAQTSGAATVAPTGPQELAVLKQQAQQLQADMELIQSRIQELETKPDKA